MSVREYIGARYVPLFADPIQWDNTKTYEPLTIVMDSGNSYTSRQYVPTGIDISNTAYWALTGNYNAQIEAYRTEVQAFDGRIDDLEAAFPIATASIADDAITSDKIADDAVIASKIPDGSITDDKLANVLTEMVIIGDSWSTTGYDATESQLWWYLFAERANLTPHNYASSGQGYVHGALKFNQQLGNANNDTTYDHNKVKYVFIFGSLNDKTEYEADEANTLNTIIATANLAKTYFPNAQVVCIGPQNPINCDALITRMTQTMRTNLQQVGHIFIPMTWVTCGLSWATNPDRLYHPTVNGQLAIAGWVWNWLYGIPMLRDRKFNYTGTSISNASISDAFIEIHNNNMHLHVVGHSLSTTNGTFNFANNVLAGLDYYVSPIIGIDTSNNTTFLSIAASGAQFHDSTAYASNKYYDMQLASLV